MKTAFLAVFLGLAQVSTAVSIKSSLLAKLEAKVSQLDTPVDFAATFAYLSLLDPNQRCAGAHFSVSNLAECKSKCLEPNCDVIQYSSAKKLCLVSDSCTVAVNTPYVSDWQTWGRHRTPVVYPPGGEGYERCEGPTKVQSFVTSFDACLNKCKGVTAFITKFMSFTTETNYCRCLPTCSFLSTAQVGGYKTYILAYKPPTKAPTMSPTEQPSAQPTTANPTTESPTGSPTFPAADFENDFLQYTHIGTDRHCAGNPVPVSSFEECKSLCREPNCNDISFSQGENLCLVSNRCEDQVLADVGNDWQHWARTGTSTVYPPPGTGKKVCKGTDKAGFVVRDNIAHCEEYCAATTKFLCKYYSYNLETKKCLVFPNCSGSEMRERNGWRSFKVIG